MMTRRRSSLAAHLVHQQEPSLRQRVEEGEGELGQEREGVSPHDESEEFVDPWTTGSGFASTSAPQDSPSTPATSFHEPSPFLHSLQYTSYEGRPAPFPHSPADYRFPPPADPAPEGYSSVMPPRRPRSPPPPKREEPGEPCVAKDASRKGKGAVEWLELDEADRAELTEKGSAAYKKAHGKVKVPRVTKKAKLEAARLLREGSRSGGTVKERKTGPKKANDLDHVPRPPNAWILYRSEQIRVLKQDQETSRKPQSEISKLIGYMWREESPAVKKAYEDEAKLRKEQHVFKYPNYRFRPTRKESPEPEKFVPLPPPSRSSALSSTRGPGRRRSSLPSVFDPYTAPRPFEHEPEDQYAIRTHTSASPPTFSRRASLHLSSFSPQPSFYEPRQPHTLPYHFPSAPPSSTDFDPAYSLPTWPPKDPTTHDWFRPSPPEATPYYAPLSAPASTAHFQFPTRQSEPQFVQPGFAQAYTTLPMEELQYEYEASRGFSLPYRPATMYGEQMYEKVGGDQYVEDQYYAKQEGGQQYGSRL